MRPARPPDPRENVAGAYAILCDMNTVRKMFNGIGAFFAVAGKSCYDMEFYRGVRTRPVKEAVWYAMRLHFALAICVTLLFVPVSLGVKAALSDYLYKTLPETASITVSHGQLSTTLSVPYELGNDSFHVIVDPSHEGTAFPEKLKTAGILLGRDAMFVRNPVDAMEVREFRTLPDLTLSRYMVLGWLSDFGGWILVLATLLFGALFWAGFLASTVLTVAVYSLFAWLFGKLWRVNMRYASWFACGLHAVTLPILINILFGFMALPIPFAYTVVYFLIMGSIVSDERSQPVSGIEHVPMAPEMVADEEVDARLPDEEKTEALEEKDVESEAEKKDDETPKEPPQ